MRTKVDLNEKALLTTALGLKNFCMLNGLATDHRDIHHSFERRYGDTRTQVPFDITLSSGAPEGENTCLRPEYDDFLTDFSTAFPSTTKIDDIHRAMRLWTDACRLQYCDRSWSLAPSKQVWKIKLPRQRHHQPGLDPVWEYVCGLCISRAVQLGYHRETSWTP